MFRPSDLKLYRKFLILAVLLGGLFVAAQSNTTHATLCCSSCEEYFNWCYGQCETTTKTYEQLWACVTDECMPWYDYCRGECESWC